MPLQILEGPVALRAQCAGVGPFPGVEAQVGLQVVLEPEALAAVRASVRPLARVEAQVPAEALAQREGLVAEGARVRLLAGVEALVPPQDLAPLKVLAADLAGHRATGHRRRDAMQPPHAIATVAEAAQPAARVEALVGTQVLGPGEAFGAHRANPLSAGARQKPHVDQLHRARLQQLPVLVVHPELKVHSLFF